VYPHVTLELVRPREAFVAAGERARERPFARVRTNMLGQVGRLDKALATVRADEWLLAIVCPHVNGERARDGESLAATGVLALERFYYQPNSNGTTSYSLS